MTFAMGKLNRVLVLGATGAVGQMLLKQLELQKDILEIAVISRELLKESQKTPKVREYLMSYGSLDADSQCFAVDAVFSAIGTTRKKAGSDSNFRIIDHDYPLEAARIAKECGVPHFLIVSAHGASSSSNFFYNRLKGQIEEDLIDLQFPSLTLIRPSILIRNVQDSRPLEEIGQLVARLFPKRWRSVPTKAVAEALVQSFLNPPKGIRVIENKEIHIQL